MAGSTPAPLPPSPVLIFAAFARSSSVVVAIFADARSRQTVISRFLQKNKEFRKGARRRLLPGAHAAAEPLVGNMRESVVSAIGGRALIGGETVELFANESLLAQLRASDGVQPADVDVHQFSFRELEAGGGKGGGLMSATKDNRLLIKQLSPGDHATLLAISAEYATHLTTTRSLISRFYWHFHRASDNTAYVVMNNILPKACSAGAGDTALYDLKGCCDDKAMLAGGRRVPQTHKRFFKVHWLVAETVGLQQCVAAERTHYKTLKDEARNIKFTLDARVCDLIKKTVEADAVFLGRAGLMDYSLLVGVITKKLHPDGRMPSFPAGGGLVSGRPAIQTEVTADGMQASALYIGIIDFLQAWTTGKRVAHVIKEMFAPHPISTIEPGAYCRQFVKANERRFVTQDDRQDDTRRTTARPIASQPPLIPPLQAQTFAFPQHQTRAMPHLQQQLPRAYRLQAPYPVSPVPLYGTRS